MKTLMMTVAAMTMVACGGSVESTAQPIEVESVAVPAPTRDADAGKAPAKVIVDIAGEDPSEGNVDAGTDTGTTEPVAPNCEDGHTNYLCAAAGRLTNWSAPIACTDMTRTEMTGHGPVVTHRGNINNCTEATGVWCCAEM